MTESHDEDTRGLDPSIAAGFGLLAALADETAALDLVLMRCRATMLLAAAGELAHLGKASGDVDDAAQALEVVSQNRADAVESAERVWEVSIGSARELLAAAPVDLQASVENHLTVQRGLLDEVTEAVSVTKALSERSLESLAKRRSELEVTGPPLTYGTRGLVPPAAVHQLA